MQTIDAHKGVDSVAFGMTRSEVARVMGHAPLRGRRGQRDESDYDFFEQIGIFVYYDVADACRAIEFTQEAKVSYDGYELFAHPAHEVRTWARTRDESLDGKDGFVSEALGLSMYAPSIDVPDLDDDQRTEPAQSFLAFRPGYYGALFKKNSISD
jgi:hypothetical protein